MKRMTVLLLVLLLSLSASAETLIEQLNVPEHVVRKYQTTSGRTHVDVSADVIVPDVTELSVYEVTSRTVEGAEFKALAEYLFGEDGYTLTVGTADFDYEIAPDVTVADGYRAYQLLAEAEDGFLQASYLVTDLAPDQYLFNELLYRSAQGGQGAQLPPEDEARALADEIVATIFPDFAFWGTERQMDIPDRRNSGDEGYRFYYARAVEGVPLSYVQELGGTELYSPDVSYVYVPPYEKLYVDVGENGVFQIIFSDPLCIGQRLSTVELLPFSQIMNIFGRMAPLSIASLETESKVDGEYNNRFEVEEIRLGYMCTLSRDNPKTFELIPVWDFYGTREYRGDRYNNSSQSLLTINAMDGTVIDRTYGY